MIQDPPEQAPKEGLNLHGLKIGTQEMAIYALCIMYIYRESMIHNLYVFVRIHDSILRLCQRESKQPKEERFTGSYKFLICFINPIIVSLLLWPI